MYNKILNLLLLCVSKSGNLGAVWVSFQKIHVHSKHLNCSIIEILVPGRGKGKGKKNKDHQAK